MKKKIITIGILFFLCCPLLFSTEHSTDWRGYYPWNPPKDYTEEINEERRWQKEQEAERQRQERERIRQEKTLQAQERRHRELLNEMGKNRPYYPKPQFPMVIESPQSQYTPAIDVATLIRINELEKRIESLEKKAKSLEEQMRKLYMLGKVDSYRRNKERNKEFKKQQREELSRMREQEKALQQDGAR